jgi:hypothetical protein
MPELTTIPADGLTSPDGSAVLDQANARNPHYVLSPGGPVRTIPIGQTKGLCMRRTLLLLAAVVLPVSALTVGLAGTAGAAGGKITCTNIDGSASSTIVISGCTGGNTGGSSEPLMASALETGGTTDWVSGSTTTTGAPTLNPALSPKKCPGYVKPPKGTTPPEPTAIGFTFAVTADSGDGMLLPSTGVGSVCVSTTGAITALKPLVYAWAPSTLTCTSIDGSASSTITVSGCSGGDTGGSSVALTAVTLATGGTIHWTSGSSTTIGAPTLVSSVGKACPGYVKPPKGTTPAEPTLEKFTASVTSDSGDGLALPGSAKGSVCISPSGTITAGGPLTAK